MSNPTKQAGSAESSVTDDEPTETGDDQVKARIERLVSLAGDRVNSLDVVGDDLYDRKSIEDIASTIQEVYGDQALEKALTMERVSINKIYAKLVRVEIERRLRVKSHQ